MSEYTKRYFFFLIVALALFLLFTQFDIGRSGKTAHETASIIIGNDITITAEIANTPDKRANGLSGKDALPVNTGMLFIFDEKGYYAFWMKDMNFPLDIIWLDDQFSIIDMKEYVSPDTFPMRFSPVSPAKYVLEANAGFAEGNNLAVGDTIDVVIRKSIE